MAWYRNSAGRIVEGNFTSAQADYLRLSLIESPEESLSIFKLEVAKHKEIKDTSTEDLELNEEKRFYTLADLAVMDREDKVKILAKVGIQVRKHWLDDTIDKKIIELQVP